MKELDEIMASCREDHRAPTYADLLVVHGAVAALEDDLRRVDELRQALRTEAQWKAERRRFTR